MSTPSDPNAGKPPGSTPTVRILKPSRDWTEMDSLDHKPLDPSHGVPSGQAAQASDEWEPPGLKLAHLAGRAAGFPDPDNLVDAIAAMGEDELLALRARAERVRLRSIVQQLVVGGIIAYFLLSLFVFPYLIEHRVWLFKWL
jgi:hypothetical protein